jgi:hypothetical protein
VTDLGFKKMEPLFDGNSWVKENENIFRGNKELEATEGRYQKGPVGQF